MKLPRSLFLLFTLAATSQADVSYSTEPSRNSQKGRLQTTIGKRGEQVIHRITRIDRGSTGTFEEFTEEFLIDGITVLSLSKINGDYMVDCQNLGTGVVSIYYKGESPRPQKLLVGKEESSSELYVVTDDGTHLATIDEDRKFFLSNLHPLRYRQRKDQLSQPEKPSASIPAPTSDSTDAK